VTSTLVKSYEASVILCTCVTKLVVLDIHASFHVRMVKRSFSDGQAPHALMTASSVRSPSWWLKWMEQNQCHMPCASKIREVMPLLLTLPIWKTTRAISQQPCGSIYMT